MFNKLFSLFSHDIGIDLGTANTLVYVKGRGVVINEPSLVALNKKTEQVVAIGSSAKQMIGRTPDHITIIRPLIEGVVSNFEITQEMLSYFIKKVHSEGKRLFARPRIVIGVPSEITEVQRRAVRDASQNAGARETYLIEEPMAAAIGIGLPIKEAVGNMIVDVGGGTTDIAVISLGGIVTSINLRIAGDKLNDDIMSYSRDELRLLLGEKTAEDVKIAIGMAYKVGQTQESTIRGRDIISGLPREVIITDDDIQEAMSKSIKIIIESVKEVIETTPPELVADVMQRGIHLVGGGSFLRGIGMLIHRETKIPVKIPESPMFAVVNGCGIILDNFEEYKSVLVQDSEEIIPQ
ncbi:MAG: rod shape-determining protein [bacterium]|nr:rod shape-determining protein [bacterium]